MPPRQTAVPPPPEDVLIPGDEGEPVDHAFVERMRATVQRLVALDTRWGGRDVVPLAVRCLRSVQRRLALGRHPASLQGDLLAAAAEMAELAGWVLHDANQQLMARYVNHEGLLLARLAGDRSMELFILSNMACQSSVTGDAREVLRIVGSVRHAGDLTNLVDVLFTIHEAIALARLERESESRRTFQRARAMLLDGPGSGDPAWAWWVDEFTLNADEGIAHRVAGRGRESVAVLEQAVADCPRRRANSRYFVMAALLEAQRQCGAWMDARGIIEGLLVAAEEMGAGRTDAMLQRTATLIRSAPAPLSVRGGADQLAAVLAEKIDRPYWRQPDLW